MMSNGGNVTIFVKRAHNLPNRDNTGAAGVSDPYVKFTVGDVGGSTFTPSSLSFGPKRQSVTASTRVISNNLNPVWNEYVSLGYLGSATEIRLEIWDSDSGLEFSDDLLVSAKVRVPFCSAFTAKENTYDCGELYGCEVSDSLWKMPSRQTCNETASINFTPTLCSLSSSMCLDIEFHMVPFILQAETDIVATRLVEPSSIHLTAAALPASGAKWTKNFGYPFTDLSISIDSMNPIMKSLIGALMLQTPNKLKYQGRPNAVMFYASTNFRAQIFVCRAHSDDLNGIPKWITDRYSSQYISVQGIALADDQGILDCFSSYVAGTSKNQYGGIEGGLIPLYSNTVPGRSNALFYSYNYVMLAVPITVVSREDVVQVVFDSLQFVDMAFSYGIGLALFLFVISIFLNKIHYRLDRVTSHLCTRVLTGKNRSLIAGLLLANGKSPSNIQYRAYLFHTRNIIYFFLSTPFWLLLSYGFSCEAKVRPAGLGLMVAFLGCAVLCLMYGLELWRRSSWRLSPYSLISIGAAVVLLIIFLFSYIFADPGVLQYGYKLNFAALSLVFGTINCVPLLLLAFKQDQTQAKHLNSLLEKMAMSAAYLKSGVLPKEGTMVFKHLQINKLLHALLGETYSINPQIPVFRFSSVLQDIPSLDTIIPPTIAAAGANEGDHEKKDLMSLKQEKDDAARSIYGMSLIVLVVYMIIALARWIYPSLALLNCFALVLLDIIHLGLSHGDVKWTPGFMILILIIGRVFVMRSPPSLWVLNYGAAYIVYSGVLLREVINNYLPFLTLRQAADIAFGGVPRSMVSNHDLAGTPAFNLGLLTLCYSIVLVMAAFGDAKEQLPTPSLTVMDMPGWNICVFGLCSILFVIIAGLLFATIRAYYLDSQGLLRGSAKSLYWLRVTIKLPLILAIITEISILLSGFLVYAATNSAAVLIGAFYIPVIIVTLGYAYRVWIANDYVLIHWPRKAKIVGEHSSHGMQENKSDLDVAFHMIENLFGTSEGKDDDQQFMTVESFDDPATADEPLLPAVRTLKGFKLPELKVTGSKVDDIKMPPLPLKSVLRKKREDLGIKTQATAVKDLRARDDAADSDKFGNSSEVLELNDPWSQFERSELEMQSLMGGRRKRRSRKRVDLLSALLKNRCLFHVQNCLVGCIQFSWLPAPLRQLLFGVDAQIFPNKYSSPDDDDDDDDEEGEGHIEGDRERDSDDVLDFEGERTKRKRKRKDKVPNQEENNALDALERGSKEVDLTTMKFLDAIKGGYLNREEYLALGCWFGGCFLIFLFGLTITLSVDPSWVGTVIWVSAMVFLCTSVIFVKYFNTYTFDEYQFELAQFVVILHVIFSVVFFVVTLNGFVGQVASLWILDYLIYFPLFSYMIFEVYRWYDLDFKFVPMEFSEGGGGGSSTLKHILDYVRATPVLMGMTIILVWQLYIWIDVLVGEIFTLLFLAGIIAFIYLRDWSSNDYFLSPELIRIGKLSINLTLFITFLVSIFSTSNPIFAISVFCFVLQFKFFTDVVQQYAVTDKEAAYYFSTYVFPVYSYNSKNQDVVDQTAMALNVLYILLTGVMWGAFMAVFYYPIDVGISISCCFLLTIAALLSLAATSMPLHLSNASNSLFPESIVEAASISKEKYSERMSPINLEIRGYNGPSSSTADMEAKKEDKTSLQKLKDRSSLTNAIELLGQLTLLKYVKHSDSNVDVGEAIDEEDSEAEPSLWGQFWLDAKDLFKSLMELMPSHPIEGYVKHNQGVFGFRDALMEMLISGRGPLGALSLNGLVYRQLKALKGSKYFYPTLLDHYDEHGNNLTLVQLSEDLDVNSIQHSILELDEAINATYEEELRTAIHFLLMLLIQADVKIQREKVLFQKFLRENRFRLAANGITPPPDVFSSTSFATVNILLVSVWLNTLSDDEYDRFYSLKQTFSIEQSNRDEQIDNADYQLQFDASKLESERRVVDKHWADKMMVDVNIFKENKVQEFVETLQGAEKQRFLNKKELWTYHQSCFVDLKDRDLYNRFHAYCINGKNFNIESVLSKLSLIEQAQKDIRLGEYGRAYQFVDSEFIPAEISVGLQFYNDVLGWRCAPGITEEALLFDGGTHPDHIVEGVFKDSWLVSAINLLAAAGDQTPGIINPQIKALFVEHNNIDGEKTLQTEVGVYCIQLSRNNDWMPIVVDDLFPMRKKEHWTNENRGLATAHNRECRGLWLPLMEKAFAKYFGSYSALERGYVHHALQDLTGSEAVCIPLSAASRGIGKRVLWESLLKYRSNGYILGAGTGASSLADKEIQDMGIVFEAAYSIYDVREVQGHQLLKLRYPPGDRPRWKGDWSESSPLWNAKLRMKMGVKEKSADDNSFYMSFDDFCNVFRYLYVCKYYTPGRWTEISLPGIWQKANVGELEKLQLQSQLTRDMGQEDLQKVYQTKKLEVQRLRAMMDSAGGLPSIHNPACILENNPHYSFRVHRPSDFRISVIQYANNSREQLVIQPISIIVTKSQHPDEAYRLEKLNKTEIMYTTGEPQYKKTVSLYGSDIPPGLYVVLVGAYMSGMEGHFKISVITNHKIEFLPVWPPAWVLRAEKGDALDSIETSLTLNSSSEQAKKRKRREEQAKNSWVNRFWNTAQKAISTTADYDLEEDEDDLEKNDDDDEDDDDDE